MEQKAGGLVAQLVSRLDRDEGVADPIEGDCELAMQIGARKSAEGKSHAVEH